MSKIMKNNKVAVVLAASSGEIYSDFREAAIFSQVSRWGYEAQVFRITSDGAVPKELDFVHEGSSLRANFFRANDYSVRDHDRISSDLYDSLVNFNPTVIFVKGFGYKVVEEVVSRFKEVAFIVGIAGGQITDSSKYCNHVYIEDEYQIPLLLSRSGLGVTYSVLPKYVDWDLVVKLSDDRAAFKKYDVICVGSVDDRKRQNIVLEQFSDLNICIAGHGPMLSDLRSKYKDFDNIEFLGYISKGDVYEKISISKLLIHVSLFEGFPRVFAESTSLGTPVVGLASTTPLPISKFRGIELCELSSLNKTVRELLADEYRYDLLRKFGIFHSSSFHTFENILINIRAILFRLNPLVDL